jgi:micrococcal nuclease
LRVRKYFICSYVILLAILWSGRVSLAKEWFSVKWVDDGDTIMLTDGRHVRYIGINAPEIAHDHQKAEPFGYAAKKYNQSMLQSKKVRLEFDKEKYDRYGRSLAYIFLQNGTFVNQAMVGQGYAYVLPRKPNLKYDRVLLQAQRNAMSAKRGIWLNWKEKEGEILGNKKSRRFHLKTCPYGKKIKHQNRIFFAGSRDAFWAGFAPCKRCLPGGD